MTRKPFSEWNDSRKEKHIAYDQKNYSVVGCKLPREVADSFRDYCKANGKTVSGMLSDYVKTVLAAESDKVTKNPDPGKCDKVTQD